MVTFVGAEYIIANSLIAFKKNRNRTNISLCELNELGIYIQKLSTEENVDAVFLTSQDRVKSAIFDFSDYFEYNEENKTICIKQTRQVTDLTSRFVGYLPWDIIAFLVKATSEFAQKAG